MKDEQLAKVVITGSPLTEPGPGARQWKSTVTKTSKRDRGNKN
jgi:hypothetical protein